MKSLLVTLLFTILSLACLPTEPCACPPVPHVVELYGIVTAASGEPVANASVSAYAGHLPCPPKARWPENRAIRTTTHGEYLMLGHWRPPAQEFCLRVVAVKPNSADSAVVEQAVSDTTRRDVARFRVHVTFPE